MQIIDLFSGIGGFSLAGHWLGWQTIQFCEINSFAHAVLSSRFPGVPIHTDIKTLDYEEIKKRIDPTKPTIVVGGFPCQPYSLAGKRLGTEDDRHLWPYCIETVKQLRPDFCVFENVLGITNWNGGLVFEEVQTDLEAQGYEVQTYVLPAAGVGAPHRRDRVWFVAFNSKRNSSGGDIAGKGGGIGMDVDGNVVDETGRNEGSNHADSSNTNVAYSNDIGCDNGSDNWEERRIQGDVGSASEDKSERSGRQCGLGEASTTQAGIDAAQTTQNALRDGRSQCEPIEEGTEDGQFGNAGAGGGDGVYLSDRDVTDTDSNGQQRSHGEHEEFSSQGGQYAQRDVSESGEDVTNTDGIGWRGEVDREGESGQSYEDSEGGYWENFPTQSPICTGNDEFSSPSLRQRVRDYFDGQMSEEEIDKIVAESYNEWRQETIKAGGNAVVPAVVLQIFKAICAYQKLQHKS